MPSMNTASGCEGWASGSSFIIGPVYKRDPYKGNGIKLTRQR
jgi:hypothetical protein